MPTHPVFTTSCSWQDPDDRHTRLDTNQWILFLAGPDGAPIENELDAQKAVALLPGPAVTLLRDPPPGRFEALLPHAKRDIVAQLQQITKVRTKAGRLQMDVAESIVYQVAKEVGGLIRAHREDIEALRAQIEKQEDAA